MFSARTGQARIGYRPSKKSIQRVVEKIHALTDRSGTWQETTTLVSKVNRTLRGWANYFAVGHASECFGFVKDWVEKKIRRHMLRARNRQGFGWARWSRGWLYQTL